MSVFSHTNYRSYLEQWIKSQGKGGRGLRSALALALHCPSSHITQMFKGISNLSLEQAEEANQFLGHSKEEAEFFLLLVQKDRAGSALLRHRLDLQIKSILERRLSLKNRLKAPESVAREQQMQFYSHWQYTAVHILLTIETYQNKDAIAKRLGISLKRTGQILDFLVEVGLAEQANGRYRAGQTRVHLPEDSPMIAKHHSNWRMRAVESLDKENFLKDLHYSSVISIAKKDAEKLRELLVKSIEDACVLIKESKEEEIFSLCLDFFEI